MATVLVAARQYGKTAAMAATSAVGESRLFLVDYVMRFLRVAMLLAVWRIVLVGRGTVSGLTLGGVLTYTLIAEVFAEQLACKTQLASDLWEGTVAMRFLQPMGLVGHYASDVGGRWCIGLGLFSLPLLLCAPLFGVNPLPASPRAAAWFVVSLLLSISVGLALEFLFGALIVVLQQGNWVVMRMRSAVTVLLSGALLPLALLPWGIGNVFAWLPFASLASAPLQIYTGTGNTLILLAVQTGWSFVLWPTALWTWHVHRERVVTYGG